MDYSLLIFVQEVYIYAYIELSYSILRVAQTEVCMSSNGNTNVSYIKKNTSITILKVDRKMDKHTPWDSKYIHGLIREKRSYCSGQTFICH